MKNLHHLVITKSAPACSSFVLCSKELMSLFASYSLFLSTILVFDDNVFMFVHLDIIYHFLFFQGETVSTLNSLLLVWVIVMQYSLVVTTFLLLYFRDIQRGFKFPIRKKYWLVDVMCQNAMCQYSPFKSMLYLTLKKKVMKYKRLLSITQFFSMQK